MAKTHSKKRNSALLYEFLVRNISSLLVEGDQKASSRSLKILRKHFKYGTQLYNEFRLINSLVKTTVSSPQVAYSIVNEAKNAAKSYDVSILDREKSLLIRDINHKIKDAHFYDQQINEYKIYATIQTLINEWRNSNPDLNIVATYEDKLVTWLTTEKNKLNDDVLSENSSGTDRLLMKVMMNKLNEKYSGTLTENQKNLIRTYVWSTANENESIIQDKMKIVQADLVEAIDNYMNIDDNSYVNTRLVEIKDKILNENFDCINDELITRFLQYMKLNDEFQSEQNEQ